MCVDSMPLNRNESVPYCRLVPHTIVILGETLFFRFKLAKVNNNIRNQSQKIMNTLVYENKSRKWLSVVNLIRFDCCVMVCKIADKQCSESLWDMFQKRCSTSNYNTRKYRDLHIPRPNLEYTKKGFHYSGIKAWNDIPVNIRELPSLRPFKIRLKGI